MKVQGPHTLGHIVYYRKRLILLFGPGEASLNNNCGVAIIFSAKTIHHFNRITFKVIQDNGILLWSIIACGAWVVGKVIIIPHSTNLLLLI